MLHKLFTLDDLYDFYEKQNVNSNFDSHKANSTIIVQIPEKFSFSTEYDPTYNLQPVHLMSCHLLENRNRSSISEKAMKEAIPSFYNRPILGYIQKIEDEDGLYHYDFAGHEMEIDEDGNVEYKECVVGIIPESCNPQLVYHDDYDKTYLEVDGYIFEDYTHAAEILRDKGSCDVSVEIAVDALSYSVDTKVLNIDQFHFMGVTILGVTTDESHTQIKPGMEGSNITLEDFSVENNSLTFNSNIINEIADAIINRIDDLKNQRKEETVEMEFEEKIEEEVTEENEVMEETTDEETPVVETEASEEAENEATNETPEVVENLNNEEETDNEPESESEETKEFDDEPTEEESEEEETEEVVDDDEQEPGYKNRTYSINGVTFETSLSEIQWAISELVNSTYSESDNDYYSVEIYEGSKTVVMIGWCTGHAYKQSYKVRNGVYSLVGDRVNVKAVYVTADEEAELDRMRNNYSSISDKLAKYESEPEKMEILNSSDYSNIADQNDFIELKKQENHFDLTVDELKNKADALLLAYAKSGKLNFAKAETETNDEPKKDFFAFARFEQNTNFLDSLLNKKH